MIVKPSAMHADDLTLLIKHFLKCQLLIEWGELDGEVFAFRMLHLSLKEEIEKSTKWRKAQKNKAKGKDDDEPLSSDEDEMEIGDALQLVENVRKGGDKENDEVDDQDGEDEDEEEGEEEDEYEDDEEDDEVEGNPEGDVAEGDVIAEGGLIGEGGGGEAVARPARRLAANATEKTTPEPRNNLTVELTIKPHLPATASDNWPSRRTFLRSLSELPEFQHLLDLLPDKGVCQNG